MAAGRRRVLTLRKKALLGVLVTLGALVFLDTAVIMPLLWSRGYSIVAWHGAGEDVPAIDRPHNVQPHPRYIWSYIPGSRGLATDRQEKRSCTIVINSEGFRDEEPADRARADFTFVALGDSFTFGWLVEREERWDERLAALITTETGRRAASVNRGMWLATFDQHALILEDHMPEQCRLVIHLIYPSHLQTINRHVDETVDNKITRVFDPLLVVEQGALHYRLTELNPRQRLAFPFTLSYLRFRQARTQFARELARYPGASLDELDIYRQAGQSQCERGWQLLEASVKQISDFTRVRGIEYVVVVVPRNFQVDGGYLPRADAELTRSDWPQKRIEAICRRTGWAGYLDLLPALRRSSARAYFEVDTHWNPEGHRAAAHEILEYLRRHKSLP